MPNVLVFQHIECEDLGAFELPLKERGFQPVSVTPYKGNPIPEELRGYAALIILGGPIGVYEQDKYPYIKDEISLIQRAIALELPILGICLGAQLLAKAAGASVYKGPKKEIGWFKIRLTEEGLKDRAVGSLGQEPHVFQWHGDTFDLPMGGIRLANSEIYLNQAFRIGERAYGLQFHLEVTEEMIEDWLSKYKQEVERLKDGIDPEKILRESTKKVPTLSIYSKRFFHNFLDLIS